MATKEKGARYISKYRELKIVRDAAHTKETNGRVVAVSGRSIRFHDGMFQTTDPEEIEFLESQKGFGSTFIRVPDDVKDLVAHRDEELKDLETRENELKEKEAALAKREAKVRASEEGAKLAGPTVAQLKKMNKKQLLAQMQEEDVSMVNVRGSKPEDIIKAIVKHRKDKASGAQVENIPEQNRKGQTTRDALGATVPDKEEDEEGEF